MSQQDLLTRVVEAIGRLEIPYMLSGSLVSSLQGEPRSTHDIDLVVDVSPADVESVVEALSFPGAYLDAAAIADATRRRSVFNLIDEASGDKVDFWLLKDEPFDRSRFGRRVRVDALGIDLVVSAPEDTILMKLRWAKESGGSDKQVTDARHVYELQRGTLDEDYLDRWAAELDVATELGALRKEGAS